jgi:nitrogen fixation protein FixH
MPRSRPIPWLIIFIGAGFVVLSAWSFYRAAGGASAVVDPDYYSHGLRYNQTLLEQRAAESLGWQVTVSHQEDCLHATLSDGNRQPVDGARGALTLFRVDSPRPQQLSLLEYAPGRYRVALPDGLAGELAAEIAFERDGVRLQRRLLLALPSR